MSGHSKWSTIKHKKGIADDKRGQLFTKLGREVTVAARGGPDPETNSTLRMALQKARDANMPKDTVERALKRGSGDGEGAALEEITYEGYGPGGTAILVEALTDNRNRTVADVRYCFSQAGGNLASAGAVAYLFDTRGVITIDADGVDPDDVALRAIDTGADDVNVEDGAVEVFTPPGALEEVRKALTEAETPIASAEIAKVPKTTVPLDERQATQVLRLLERLEDLDDVQRVSTNADFPAEALAAYA